MATEEAPNTAAELAEEELLYNVEDVPPWHMTTLMGLQHYLQMIGATLACPFFLIPALCMEETDPDQANIISTLVFMSGIITILQSTFGTRLPIVQGASFSYLIPALAILRLPEWQCPAPAEFQRLDSDQKTEVWQLRMREIQGAIIVASLVEVLFGLTGLAGILSRRLTALTIAPAISLIGIALFKEATVEASKNFAVAISTLLLLIILSQYLKYVKIPVRFKKVGKTPVAGEIPAETSNGGQVDGFPIFQVFAILISILFMWMMSGILTVSGAFAEGDPARSDSKLKILYGSPWFRIPYPFQWGWPTVSLGAVLGIMCGVVTSSVESIGDYCACATICKKPIPPPHALNRGLLTEGFGCFLGGLWGSGNGTTSYSANIGTIAITRVASRRVIQVAGVLMVVFGLIGKAGAVFLSLPDPIMAGLFLYLFPLILGVGLGTLADISMASARNVFIVSFAIFIGLAVSQWSLGNPGIIDTGSLTGNNVLQIILNTGMFIAGITGFVLDNTIPGTDEERGINRRKAIEEAARVAGDNTYDLPFIMDALRRWKWTRWVPISPTFNSFQRGSSYNMEEASPAGDIEMTGDVIKA